jgi:cystinosin
MDFSGGALSFAQILVDSVARGKPVFGTGSATGFDIIKFMLSVISMIFDGIFLWQHFVLYNPNKRLLTTTSSQPSKKL